MRRLRTLLTLLLLAVWLPAALHCDLVAAGVVAEELPTAAPDSGAECEDGFCHAVEGKIIRPDSAEFALQAPALAWIDLLLGQLAPPLPAVGAVGLEPERSAVPPELRPTWQFVRRAASPPRAPSALS